MTRCHCTNAFWRTASANFSHSSRTSASFRSCAGILKGGGTVNSTLPMPTRRLDDIKELPQVDFLKIDVQGSELMILENGRKKLADCVALQTAVSFVALYKNQPMFGDIDR